VKIGGCLFSPMKKYPKIDEDSYVGEALRKWRKKIKATKRGYLYS
jgi:hypothetical protein